MKLSDFRDLLLTIGPPVHHYFAKSQKDSYIVWAEDTESGASFGDDKKSEQVIQGTIDYFTKTEFDENVKKIQEILNDAEIPWYLSSIQHERDAGYIHYEWIFSFVWELI